MTAQSKQPADIDWRGNSLEVLSGWPSEVKQTLGFELRKVQNGEKPSDSKPLTDVGKGVFELVKKSEISSIGLRICPNVEMKLLFYIHS